MEASRRLQHFIEQELMGGEPDRRIGEDDELLLSGIVDSLGVFRVVSFIETELGVRVPAEDVTLEHFQTVAAMVRYVESRRT